MNNHITPGIALASATPDFVIERLDAAGRWLGAIHDPALDSEFAHSFHFPPTEAEALAPVQATRFANLNAARRYLSELVGSACKYRIVEWRGFGDEAGYQLENLDGWYRTYAEAAHASRITGASVVRSSA